MNPIDVACPNCKVGKGRVCKDGNRRLMLRYHLLRWADAINVATIKSETKHDDDPIKTKRTSTGHILLCQQCSAEATWLNWQLICFNCVTKEQSNDYDKAAAPKTR